MWTLASDGTSLDRIGFCLPAGSVKTIGRSPGADLVVNAALVSRMHCQVAATADGLEVKDLNSTNGTFVNGARVTLARLLEGDRLSVGRVDLIVSRSA